MTDVIPAAVSFLALCIAWVAIGRRHSVRYVRIVRDDRAA